MDFIGIGILLSIELNTPFMKFYFYKGEEYSSLICKSEDISKVDYLFLFKIIESIYGSRNNIMNIKKS
jgi:hypothetical protein